MKKLFLFFTSLLSTAVFSQQQYWQQEVNYTIDVNLDDKKHTLDGFEKIVYTNNSPDTLRYIWFHTWPNAYKNDKTAFTEGQLKNGNTAFYFAGKEDRGYLNRLDFKVDGMPSKWEDHPHHIDIIKLVLPKPLPPLQKLTITTPFHVQLPYNFSRGGHIGKSYQATQWYPKPAVYDRYGWHEMPYLDQGEFFSEFGSFDVRITVPTDYVVAATGSLQNEDEKKWLFSKTGLPAPPKKTAAPTAKKKPYADKKRKEKVIDESRPATELKTLQYLQNNVHDFAWFADKSFIVNSDTCILNSGKRVQVYTYYTPQQKKVWANSITMVKNALRFYSTEVGEYPYDVVSAVQGPQGFGGGMEYPTITVIAPMPTPNKLDIVLAHEVGHNWFYGILANNERKHPWMDEGLNSYYEYKYKNAGSKGKAGVEQDLLLRTKIFQKLDQPITSASEDLNFINYGLVTYHKTAKWLELVEERIGKANFTLAMQRYYAAWKFKHPQPEDLKASFAPFLGDKTEEIFSLLSKKGDLPRVKSPSFQIATPFTLKNYIQNPASNLLFLSPAIGSNKYDGLMLGIGITNYKLPPTKFQFLLLPLYGTKSNKLNGAGNVSYTAYPDNIFQQVRLSVGAMNFSKRTSLDSMGNEVFERFTKVAPAIRFKFKEAPKSSRERAIELKSFLIRESNFDKFVVKQSDGLTYVDSSKGVGRYVNQVSFTQDDYRALYPYDYRLQLQQGKGFYRVNFTSNYFFNYAKGGGLNVRLFGAKFGYLGEKENNFGTFNYRPKLLGVTGEEDFTYSNYFMGRTASSGNADDAVIKNKGLGAHQIMIRDGAFKLRFDQYEFLQGRSENWVAATNLTTSIPKKILPFLPLKLFLDIGSYAEAWNAGATGSRFLYVAGLQLSLIHNFINIYAPIVYSNEFKEYVKVDKLNFFKRLSFSIDLQQIQLRKITNGALSL